MINLHSYAHCEVLVLDDMPSDEVDETKLQENKSPETSVVSFRHHHDFTIKLQALFLSFRNFIGPKLYLVRSLLFHCRQIPVWELVLCLGLNFTVQADQSKAT